MNAKEETYKVTVHLIDGTKLESDIPVEASQLMAIYAILGRDDGGRIKFPTRADTMQFLPASSVLRIEAKGSFE